MIKACLFDLGNVLLHFSHAKMWKQLGALAGVPADAVKEALSTDRFLWRYEAGQVSTAELLAVLRGMAKASFTDAAVMQAASDIFEEVPGMLAVLAELRGRGQRLVLVSNTCEAHMLFAVPRYPLFKHLDQCIFSYEVKAMKPEPAFYAAAHRASGYAPDECVFIDDLPENIAGAQSYGFHGHVFTGLGPLRAELQRLGIIG